MGLFRLLFWFALIAAGLWLWRKAQRPPSTRQQEPDSVPMVRCAQCGVHLPRQSALHSQNHWYCSQQHLEQGPH